MAKTKKSAMRQYTLILAIILLVNAIVLAYSIATNRELRIAIMGIATQQANMSTIQRELVSSLKSTTVVDLKPDTANKSTQKGFATLVEEGGKVKVVINASAYGAAQPAHIHTGACPKVGKVVYPLNNVVDGKSETILDVTMKELKAQMPLALNIHKSEQEAKIYTACGNLPL